MLLCRFGQPRTLSAGDGWGPVSRVVSSAKGGPQLPVWVSVPSVDSSVKGGLQCKGLSVETRRTPKGEFPFPGRWTRERGWCFPVPTSVDYVARNNLFVTGRTRPVGHPRNTSRCPGPFRSRGRCLQWVNACVETVEGEFEGVRGCHVGPWWRVYLRTTSLGVETQTKVLGLSVLLSGTSCQSYVGTSCDPGVSASSEVWDLKSSQRGRTGDVVLIGVSRCPKTFLVGTRSVSRARLGSEGILHCLGSCGGHCGLRGRGLVRSL